MRTSRWSEPRTTWEATTCGTSNDDGRAAKDTEKEAIGVGEMNLNPAYFSDFFRETEAPVSGTEAGGASRAVAGRGKIAGTGGLTGEAARRTWEVGGVSHTSDIASGTVIWYKLTH